MSAAGEIAEAPFASRRALLGGLAVSAALLGLLVYVDVIPRLNPPPPVVEGKPFLPSGFETAKWVEITRGRKDFRLEKVGDGWEILDHGERAPIPDGWVDDALETMAGLVELIDIGPRTDLSEEEFGFSPPMDRVSVGLGDGREIQILLGDRNPPLTGVYALVLPGEHVVLVGAVLLLEIEKLAALASAEAPSKSLTRPADG